MRPVKADETTTGWLEFARAHAEGAALAPLGWERLAKDAQTLGLFGLLAAAALREAPESSPEVRDELATALRIRLKEEGQAVRGETLAELAESYRAAKGERGAELLGRLVARQVYEVYGLREHGFLGEDALLSAEVLAAGRGGACAREAARRTLRLSRTAARCVLGHLDGQLELVHRLAHPEAAVPTEQIDQRLTEFAPRVFAQRWPSLVKRLLVDDKRFRFVVVLWARLRGVELGRQELFDLSARIDAGRPMLLVQLLEESRPAREVLVLASAASPAAALCEAACALARPLPPL